MQGVRVKERGWGVAGQGGGGKRGGGERESVLKRNMSQLKVDFVKS